MSGGHGRVVVTYKERREDGTMIVDCPFCGEEHGHFVAGINVAICGQGEYSVIAPR